ncbi:methylmalonyl-CoA mutase family protein [Chelatococcus sp. GCM10030263]|uniref:methylmalonyl-CoA mutase family protein n=1 Tax=Chelatococcus sp. GCM10030263 TaxID=3273387 RepID=UPI00361F4936
MAQNADSEDDALQRQWLGLVRKLVGEDALDRLKTRTPDGRVIEPLYAKADQATPLLREPGRWRIVQPVDHPDPSIANELARADRGGGADGLTLVAAGSAAARGFGLALRDADDIARVLDGIAFDGLALRIEPGARGLALADLVIAFAESRGFPPETLDLDCGLDPIGRLTTTGAMDASWDETARSLGKQVKDLRQRGFQGAVLRADGRPYHEAGASDAQELAAVVATALAYLRATEAGGLDLGDASKALSFLLVADADQFATLAKFRALRRLWARVEEACGLAPAPIRLHGETAWRMTTRRDPWVNMLRAVAAIFGAGLGGADSLTVLPFTAALGLADPFARRIARNAQIVLMEEAHLWRVADPAAGSGAIEALTEGLCEAAWPMLQSVERDGGMVAALEKGTIQRDIVAVRATRERALATRQELLTGTSAYPDLAERPANVLMPAPTPAAMPAAKGAVSAEPLPSRRLAEPFEALRDWADAHRAETGEAPKICLVTLGPTAAHAKRAAFARQLFAIGGFVAVTAEDVGAFAASGAHIACLCASDEIHAAEAGSVARALKEAGAALVFIAGRPQALEDALRAAGVAAFLTDEVDCLAILREAAAVV